MALEITRNKRKTLKEMHEDAYEKNKRVEHYDVFECRDEYDDDDADCCTD